MSAPLDGIVVVALEQAVAAPIATRHLADLGASVIKVERPGVGDFAREYDSKMSGQSTFFVWANRGKQSIVLDLKDPDDRRTFDAMIAGADVFIQNLSPAAAERSGVLAGQLLEKHPTLIACDVNGYGLGGPRTDDKAYDLAIQAEAGAMAVTGSADEMSKVGFSVADICAGMYAFSSILAALYRRSSTGEGAAISLSMLECLAEWTSVPIYSAVNTGVTPTRAGHRHALIAPYGLYALSDGSRVMVVVQSNAEWASFAEHVLADSSLIDDERFAENPERIANIDELESAINSVFSSHTPDEMIDRLERGRIAWARARSPIEVWEHEQLAARDRFMTVATPTGETTMFKPPFEISGVPDPRPHVPALGEHDPALLERLLGMSSPASDIGTGGKG